MITLNNISKSYQQNGTTITALNDISLDIQAGEIYGVVGESGAGKSTLIRCVNLLETPTSGEVIIDGQPITKLKKSKLLQIRHNVGMIFQHFNLLAGRTVFQNIALPLELTHTPKAQIKQKVTELLKLTGLETKSHHYPAQLSGGQKQRVAIARALAGNSKILLSDEATSSLDPKTTASILKLLRDINKKLGVTILLITHEMDVVKAICDKVALLDHGKLVETASVEDFFFSPQSELGKKFVAQIQKVELPEKYAEKIKSDGHYPVMKIDFRGENVSVPILSQLTRQFDIDVNIVQAKLEQIRSLTTGFVIAELIAEPLALEKAVQWLKTQPVFAEVIGHV